ncbi:MAG: glycosyltransferase family 2 protein [Thermoleophilia bacterium]|nr:glycosyltransferase family 2 protein [Thermoleophilia bacterium]
MPEVAVVVGNYEGERVLPDLLASLQEQTAPPAEVIVVDAGSRDRSRELAAAAGARILLRENRGLGHLYNEGARAAVAELVLLANNDVALEPPCLELLAAALAESECRFAADPTQLDWEGREVVHARTVLRRGPLLRRPLPGFALDDTVTADDVVPTLLANGAAMLVRREELLRLGGFDETFFLEFEEIDLCWRAWLAGLETVYVPHARVRHRVGAVTSSALRARRLRSAHHNLLRFALKCLPARAAAVVLAGELLRLPRHPTLVAPALARVGRELPEILRARRSLGPKGATFARLLAPDADARR